MVGEEGNVEPESTTLLALVVSLAGTVEEIIVEQARQLITSGQVRLIGNYAGARFDK